MRRRRRSQSNGNSERWRRLDVILAVETRMDDRVRGVTRALAEDPAVARTLTALKAAIRSSAFR
jgi:hypothetical protein